MKANVKRMLGLGALSCAMLANMSLSAFAADAEPQMLMSIEAVPAITAMTRIDEASGKMQVSADEGKTWETIDNPELAKLTPSIPADAVEMKSVMVRANEETGKFEVSEDEGKTWTTIEDMPDIDLGEGDVIEATACTAATVAE